jgi:hypothetical protein
LNICCSSLSNGYELRYEPRAVVNVKAPDTVDDFIKQKARVRAGYYLLPKSSAPRKASREVLMLPKELLKIPIWRWPKFIIAGCIYLYTWYKGRQLAKRNASLNEIWKIPKSTK